MNLVQGNIDRLIRFNQLYEIDLGDSIDLNEFGYDELYAFQVLKRAGEAGSPELRNLAAHLETSLKEAMESVTLHDTDQLSETWRLDRPPAAAPANSPVNSPAAAPVPALENRRRAAGLLSPDEILRVGRFKRIYESRTGKQFDIARFAADDAYGRALLQESGTSPHPDLAAIAAQFLDAKGQPSRHRRNRE